MDAKRAMITDIVKNNILLEVPFFQRSYVWDKDLWERLLEDMEYVCKSHKTHFLGSIILKEGEKPKEGEGIVGKQTVVDGQQRLTTFLIYLKVLSLKKKDYTFFDLSFRILGKEMALKHGKNDAEAFEKVMNMEKVEKIEDTVPSSQIIKAFNYYIDNLNADNVEMLTVMMNTLFVKIDLFADEDEQPIFDSLNSLGVNLTTSELLKNYFFNRDTVDEYEKKWVSVFEKDDDARIYWDTQVETGRTKRALIDIFFDSYFQLFIQDRKYNISNEDKVAYERVDQLAQSYRHFIDHYCGGNKDVVLSQLKDYATCFNQTFDPEDCSKTVSSQSGIERLNVIIFGLKNTTLIPYVLYITKNVYDKDELNRMYGILESYMMRRIVVHATTKNYNRLFTSLILNGVLDSDSLIAFLRNDSDATTYIPSDDEIDNGFLQTKLVNLHSKGIIYLIESYLHPANSSTTLLGFDSYSLEHLMPKKWRNNWPKCESEEEGAKRDAILLTLGNLAIITQSLNASIRDADWVTKKAGKGNDKPGLKLCSGGLTSMENVLDKNEWDEAAIRERAEWLSDKAKTLWNL